jgi:hypothetical protein
MEDAVSAILAQLQMATQALAPRAAIMTMEGTAGATGTQPLVAGASVAMDHIAIRAQVAHVHITIQL